MFKLIKDDTGIPHPAMLSRPALRSDCIRYFDAFRLLGASRIWSQVGPQPIQMSEINALMEMQGLSDPETKLKYARLIQIMDRVELKFQHQRTKR